MRNTVMKFLIPALIIIGVIAAVFLAMFSVKTASFIGPTTPPPTQVTKVVLAAPSATSTDATVAPKSTPPSSFIPSNFHGPTSAPHVVGPTSPPPDY